MKKLTSALGSLLLLGTVATAGTTDTTSAVPLGDNWYVSADAIGSAGTITDTVGLISATLNMIKVSDNNYISLGFSVDSMFTEVTGLEIVYTSDKSVYVGISDTASTYGWASKSKLAAGTDVKKTLNIPTDFAFSWSGDDKPVPLNLSEVNGISFDATVAGDTKLTIKSLRIIGLKYDTSAPEFVLTDTVQVIQNDFFGFSANLSDSAAAVPGDSAFATETGTPVEVFLQSKDGTVLAGADLWGPDAFTLDGLVSIELTYTSDVDFDLTLPMVNLPETETTHIMSIPAASTETTKNFNVGAFVQAEGSTALTLATVPGFGFALPDTTLAGKITLTSAKLIYTGDVVSTIEPLQKSKNISVSSITNSKMQLTVPQSGLYTISLYAVNGRLLKSLTSQLTAGNNAIAFANLDQSGKMAIVKITGENQMITTKALIK